MQFTMRLSALVIVDVSIEQFIVKSCEIWRK